MPVFSLVAPLPKPAVYEICQHFEFHIVLIQLALLTVSSFMHLYFLLKAMIMVVTVTLYVLYLHYFDVYDMMAKHHDLASTTLFLQTTFEVVFFILLLIGLDRRVSSNGRVRHDRSAVV